MRQAIFVFMLINVTRKSMLFTCDSPVLFKMADAIRLADSGGRGMTYQGRQCCRRTLHGIPLTVSPKRIEPNQDHRFPLWGRPTFFYQFNILCVYLLYILMK